MDDQSPKNRRSKRDDSATRVAQGPNRGLLLDVFAFALNIATMTGVSHVFRDVFKRAGADDPWAIRILFFVCIAMFVLAPIGAVLGRWHFHQRMGDRRQDPDHDPMGGCLFNPIFYFCLTAVIFSAVNAFVMQSVYGRKEPDGGVFVGSILFGILLMITHTVLVYRYFSPPKQPPKSRFLKSSVSKYLSDAMLFANMALFQQFWGLLGEVDAPSPSSAFDVVFRILTLTFLALLVYFPPRMFYLAEDVGKRWVWASILLANAPIIGRFVFGWGT